MLNDNSCVICKEDVTDPVCRDCYIKQTLMSLNDLKINNFISETVRDKLKNKFHLETLNDTECILCKKDTVTVCHYCFSLALIDILRELNFTEELIRNFYHPPVYEKNSLDNEIILVRESVADIQIGMNPISIKRNAVLNHFL